MTTVNAANPRNESSSRSLPCEAALIGEILIDRHAGLCLQTTARRCQRVQAGLGALRSILLRGLGELFEETHVAGVEVADVGDAVEHHGDALDSHAEGEAGDLFWIVGVV